MHEVARILAPGAPIEITVPNARGMGRLDELNMFRYLHDTSGRSGPSSKLAEVGWRRHYDDAELTTMMIRAGFKGLRTQAVGLGLREPRVFRDAIIGPLAKRRSPFGRFGTDDATGHVDRRFTVLAQLGAHIVATATRVE